MKRKCSAPYNNSSHIKMSGAVSTSSRHQERSTRPALAFCRFLIKYRCFMVPIGLFMIVQLVLAIRLVFTQSDNADESSTAYGPRLKWSKNENANNVQPNASISTSTSATTILDLNTLSFIPECNITSKDAVSAIQRARTQVCKEQLATTACKIVHDALYPKRLSRKCFNNETKYGKYIGCFKDDKKQRILPDYFILLKENNSPQNCIDMCLQSGFQYAGVQYGIECFCGNELPSSEFKFPSSTECNMKCPTDAIFYDAQFENHEFCGGYFTMNVFETGVLLNGYDGKSQIIGLDEYSLNIKSPEKPVRIVFFLTLNGRGLRQIYRLIKSLFHERHFFYIHIDARQDYLYRELLSLSHKLPNNVKFMANRRGTIWGGASLLTILLNGMKELTLHAQQWNWDWDYVINLSESDFPLKTTDQLEYFLSQNIGKNFLKSHGRDVQKFIQKQGLDKTFDECEYRMWRVGDRKLPIGIFIDGGSDWIALHRNFVEYAVKTDDELVNGLKTVFKHTLLPAESFFHTLLRNSEMCNTFVDNNLHVTNWRRKLGCKCQYRNIVDWCGCSPNDFRSTDWSRLQLTDSRLLFFGRKFEAIVNQRIINELESWLYPERRENNFSTLDRFWLSLYHHHDLSPKPDDALITLGRSLSRIASKLFISKRFPALTLKFEENSNISAYKVDLIEITAHNHDDKLEGILVKFQTSLTDSKTGEEFEINIETWFKQEVYVETVTSNPKSSKYHSKLKDLKVGGDYEQKEQIFRNFAGGIGPFSEPSLMYSVHTDEPFNISVVWFDPRNVAQSTTNVTVSDGAMANFVKPTLKTPLMSGNWTVKILTENHQLLYRVKFLVFPLEVHQGKMISLSERRLINFETFNESNESKTTQYLQQKIDTLVLRHYSVQDFCLEKNVNQVLISRWTSINNKISSHQSSLETLDTSLCSHTQWSSFYPDPKSSISGIDPKTGLLMP